MSALTIYRADNRFLFWAAFVSSILIHIVAVTATYTDQTGPTVGVFDDSVIATVEPVESPSAEEPPPIDPPLETLYPPIVQPDVPEEHPVPPVHRVTQWRRLKSSTADLPGPVRMSAAKAAAINAPKPDYPYEARRQHASGSGLAILYVDGATGSVTRVEMRQSTGNKLLDHATITAFERWRFRPGTASIVQTPITFTLMGAQY
jgi:periplasmic protein TonB